MTKDINKMTQAEFDDLMVDLKENEPNLFQFIVDFINKKVSIQEVEDFQKMEHEAQRLYIKNYKARA
ncbi:hypothetical protein [Streptococcus salivarius]|uniref:hypothetical protein n=1 Tax=Streptococcus salivarius TaxID=1304 RepID=UPI001BDA8C9A|nr:hypothetical protein [Streptococcus salivarius]MBT0911855.1 hypothetical protein [Streptococcus salivarius]